MRYRPPMNVQPAQMSQAADAAAELLKALANRHRLLIVCQLIEGERSVGDLAAFLGIRNSTVSQHLALMRKDGIVSARRDGQTIWYSIASPAARQVIENSLSYLLPSGARPHWTGYGHPPTSLTELDT